MGERAAAEDDGAAGLSRYGRRREEILTAAGAVFNRHGLRDATLAVIAAETGLNLKSLRYYFEKREDLVVAAFMRSIALHQRLAEGALAESGAASRVRRFVRSYFDLRVAVERGERPEFVHFGDLRALAPPHSDTAFPAYSQMFRAIRRLLQEPGRDWPRRRLNASAHMVLSQLLWSVVWAGPLGGAGDAARVADQVCDVLLNGIAGRKLDLAGLARRLPPPEPERDRLSKDAFLRAATRLINRHGYRGASVDRISAEMGVSKGAFYHYNETRDSLVAACFEQSFALIRAAQDAASAEPLGLSQAAAAAVSLVERQTQDDGTLLRTSALTAVGPELRARMAALVAGSTNRFGDMLNQGLIDGSVRPCNIRVAAEMVTATINSAEELGRWVGGVSAADAVELYVRPLLDGLLAPADP